MAVADLAKSSTPTKAPAGKCSVCHALNELPKDKAKTLVALLSNPQVRYMELSDELAADPDWSLVIDHQALSRHARAIGPAHHGMKKLR